MDVEAAPNPLSDAAKQEPPAKRTTPSALGWTIFLFAIFWAAFYGLSRGLPYLKNGSDIVFGAKLQWEQKGQVFPVRPCSHPGLDFRQQQDPGRFCSRLV